MRIRITHDTVYRYATPVKSAIQVLRLTPRDYDGQFVAHWDLQIDGDCRLARREDWFGNTVHGLTMYGPVAEICLRAAGEVETEDHAGVVRGTVERFPPGIFLRETRLTTPVPEIAEFARAAIVGEEKPLHQMHALMGALSERLRFDTGATEVVTTAAEAFGTGHGVCQDFTHIFLVAARGLGIPARYVSGYLYRADAEEQDATHAWAEAFIKDLGWVAFDATNAVCATESYVRIAVGLDYLDCAPVKGSYQGGGPETLHVKLKIRSAQRNGA
jgi:transglutaminase-like putative cysteine protease